MTEATKTWRGRAGTIFAPARLLLSRLAYGPKFLLIAAVLLVPFAYVTQSQYRSVTHDIVFNQGESDGVIYIQPLKDYLHAVQRHRVLSAAALSGGPAYRHELAAAVAEASQKEKAVDDAEARFGAGFKSSARWADAKAAWARARTGRFASAAEADAAHQTAQDTLGDLILNYVANYSNLILDPDLDSYWLMDAYVAKLPTLGNTAARATAVALTSSADDKLVELAGLYKINLGLVGDLEAINLKTAFEETKKEKNGQSLTLEPALTPAMATIKKGVEGHAAELKRQHLTAGAPAAIPTLVDATLAALSSISEFWDRTGPELKWLADKRVKKYQGERTVALVAAVVAALLLVYLFVGFYLSVRGSVDALAEATRRMIAGTTETFELEARDELGGIARSYNDINLALVEARTLQQRVQKDNDELQDNIMQLLAVVSDASDGDLTVRAKVTTGAMGNVADAFNGLLESLSTLIGEVNRQVARTNDSIQAISQASQLMAQGATSQAREVIGATQLVERMVQEVSTESANMVTGISSIAREQVDNTRQVVRTMAQITAIARETQTGAEGTLVTITQLMALSSRLTQTIGRFRVAAGPSS